MILLKIFSRRWILTTLLVIVAMGVMVRLGIWQLDRLEKRKAFNARVEAQLSQPVLLMDANTVTDKTIVGRLSAMEYRSAFVKGQYDHSYQVALRAQYHDNQYGVHLITPLRIEGSNQVILVNRGWIPIQDWESGSLEKYDQPGIVEVSGMIRPSMNKADFGSRNDPTQAPGAGMLKAWNFVNIPAISNQTPYPLLPVYIQQAPDPAWTQMPHRSLPEIEISEGSHMSYAIQWFTFATILGAGYPFFIRKQENSRSNHPTANPDRDTKNQHVYS